MPAPTERNITAEVLGLIAAKVVKPAFFFSAAFPAGTTRIWTGRGPYVHGGHTWDGIGAIVQLNSFSETIDTASQGMQVRLDGLSETVRNAMRRQPYQGREVYAELGFWTATSSGEPVIAFVPEPIWKGTLDTDDSQRSKSEVSLVLYCEHRMGDILRKREWRYTDRDQQELHPPIPGEQLPDTGLNKLEMIMDLTVPWGRPQA